MTVPDRKDRIAQAFAASAFAYDAAAEVQWIVARRLSDRIARMIVEPLPQRILEVGCGTGFLSMGIHAAFPQADLTLTDIAATMLERCRQRVHGATIHYQVMDGEFPDSSQPPYDLIVSSLAFQWFVDVRGGLARLAGRLAPGGKLVFATLGPKTFQEWRLAHERLGYRCGTPLYPAVLPWPEGYLCRQEEELLLHPYADGHDFVRSLKALGAGEPAPGHKPLSPAAFRRLLATLQDSFSATYHLIYGVIEAPL